MINIYQSGAGADDPYLTELGEALSEKGIAENRVPGETV